MFTSLLKRLPPLTSRSAHSSRLILLNSLRSPMPRLHQTKRKRSDKGVVEEEEEEIGAGDIATRFEEAFVKSKGSTEMAVIYLLHKYNFDLDTLKAQLACSLTFRFLTCLDRISYYP